MFSTMLLTVYKVHTRHSTFSKAAIQLTDNGETSPRI